MLWKSTNPLSLSKMKGSEFCCAWLLVTQDFTQRDRCVQIGPGAPLIQICLVNGGKGHYFSVCHAISTNKPKNKFTISLYFCVLSFQSLLPYICIGKSTQAKGGTLPIGIYDTECFSSQWWQQMAVHRLSVSNA